MITLFTIFHIFLFPVQESGKTTCEEKLEALDFIYEYDKEPAVCTHDFCDKGIENAIMVLIQIPLNLLKQLTIVLKNWKLL